MFQTIERAVPEPIRDLGRSIDAVREHLLNGFHSDLACAAQLQKNWYFLESAIRSAACDISAQRGSLPFRIFAEYSRTSTLHSAVGAVLAQANRLLNDGEEPRTGEGVIMGSSGLERRQIRHKSQPIGNPSSRTGVPHL
jgi:hypothetical protein